MLPRICVLAAVLVSGLRLAPGAQAMDFRIENRTSIVATGKIVGGDDARLRQSLSTLSDPGGSATLALDSPGGLVAEAIRMARTIRGSALTVTVQRECASACFLLLAAGPHRRVAKTAAIGVHSASNESGRDDDRGKVGTVVLAREAAALGVPDSIIGKMVMTPPNQMTWLNAHDLDEMGVAVLAPAQGQEGHEISAMEKMARLAGIIAGVSLFLRFLSA